MLKYIIGAAVGGIVGYFVLYKLIGCSSGSCPITANPYISTVYGIVIGLLIAGLVTLPSENKSSALSSESQTASQSESLQTSASEYKKISSEEAKSRIDSGDEVFIIDVRTAEEYNSGHIPNAILIPNETISNKMPDLLPDLNAEILVYCRSGNRSAQAARKLLSIGYTNVYDFGGINNWPYETVKEN